jgi:Holliday junction resolvase RusA-like endonuclease
MDCVDEVYLRLPAPISANAIWRSYNGRNIKSSKYRDWISATGLVAKSQRPGRIEGHYVLRIAVPVKTRIDLDNAVKGFSDLAQSLGIISNDNLCDRLEVWRGEDEFTHIWFVSVRKEAGQC